MILTKYQEKQLRYHAKSNKVSTYSTLDTPTGKVKHREFNGLSYDESKDSNGNVTLSNILLHGKPFDGTYEELLDKVKTHDALLSPDTVEDCPSIQLDSVTNTGSGPDAEPLDTVVTYKDFDAKNMGQFSATMETNGAETEVAYEKPRKPLTKSELNDLRIKCATMKLAAMYGEPKDSSILSVVSKYPDAVDALNSLYSKDGIKPYTVSEDAIQEAYPEEYEAAKNT